MTIKGGDYPVLGKNAALKLLLRGKPEKPAKAPILKRLLAAVRL